MLDKFSLFLKQLFCLHEPDITHGYDELPAKNSHCLWCGKELGQ